MTCPSRDRLHVGLHQATPLTHTGGYPLSAACTNELASVTPDTEVDTAAQIMRDMAVRRLPVVEAGKAVGIVSIGDLAIKRDPNSALADISAAPPNT